MGLSNFLIILLDNLIYLDETVRGYAKDNTIGDIVHNLLYAEGDPANGIGTGSIQTDWRNHYKEGDSPNCLRT